MFKPKGNRFKREVSLFLLAHKKLSEINVLKKKLKIVGTKIVNREIGLHFIRMNKNYTKKKLKKKYRIIGGTFGAVHKHYTLRNQVIVEIHDL